MKMFKRYRRDRKTAAAKLVTPPIKPTGLSQKTFARMLEVHCLNAEPNK